MTNLEVFLLIAVLLILIGGGVILYLALAGLAIIYSMGANESPKRPPYLLWRPGCGYDNCLCVCFHLFTQVRVAVMKLREFLTVFEQSDRLRIVKNEKDVYTGFLALMAHTGGVEELMDAEVKRFRPTPEIRHKEWRKRGLMAPLQPQETPEYSFSDLQMNLYNTIYL